MHVDTLLAERDPARRHPLPGPVSAEAAALYARIVRSPGTTPRKAPGPRRRIVIGAVTGAAAAGLAAGFVVTSQPAVRRPTVNRPTAINVRLTARQVLDKAAAAALTAPATAPRPDQFVYTRFQAGGHLTQMWLSVDGTRNGLVKGYIGGANTTKTLPGCTGGKQQVRLPGSNGKPYHPGSRPSNKPAPMDGPVITEPCTPRPAFFPDMPTKASATPGYLTQVRGVRLNDINDVAKTVGEMFEFDYLLPAQRAALYEFLATTHGLTIRRNVHGIGGRPEVAVGWSLEGDESMLIFDPASFTLVGWGVPGQVSGDFQMTQPVIVNQVGQLP